MWLHFTRSMMLKLKSFDSLVKLAFVANFIYEMYLAPNSCNLEHFRKSDTIINRDEK